MRRGERILRSTLPIVRRDRGDSVFSTQTWNHDEEREARLNLLNERKETLRQEVRHLTPTTNYG